MGNRLDARLDNKYVVLLRNRYPNAIAEVDRVFLCQSGFGCNPAASGTKVYGEFITDGEGCHVSGYEVEREATPDEIKQAYRLRVDKLKKATPISSDGKENTCMRCGYDYIDTAVTVIKVKNDIDLAVVCDNCLHSNDIKTKKTLKNYPCEEYYKPKQECMKMTRILQEHGVIAYHASMKEQRNCCGIMTACYFQGQRKTGY